MKRTFKTSCDPDRLKALRAFVRKTLNEFSLPQKEIDMMILAVDEICANRIIHSNDCDKKESIELIIERTDSGILFEISDTGKPFNYNEYNEPDTDKLIESGKKGGFGLKIVRKIMDRIDYKTTGTRSVCRLFKHINSQA